MTRSRSKVCSYVLWPFNQLYRVCFWGWGAGEGVLGCLLIL
jgi:hypothetical protein